MKTVLAMLFLLASVSMPVGATNQSIELVIVRSAHELLVKQGNVTLRTFKVALGSGGKKAKLRAGDHTTPKGHYTILKVRDSDRFHLFLQIDYPNMDDAKRALKNHTITLKEYRAILLAHKTGHLPPQNTALGGSIGIHGIGKETKDKIEIHQIADWTQGCIALRNHEVEELSRYIDVGTQVSIIE